MGSIYPLHPLKLICAILYPTLLYLEESFSLLSDTFGPIDSVSASFPFDYSAYYESEMGMGLTKCFVSFKNLVNPEQLAEIKHTTNKCEEKLAQMSLRKVNFDPGALSLHNVILLTTKNYTHRIPLQKGIYAELTLMYTKGTFHFLPWTYPDYKTDLAIRFFEEARNRMGLSRNNRMCQS